LEIGGAADGWMLENWIPAFAGMTFEELDSRRSLPSRGRAGMTWGTAGGGCGQ